MQPMFGVETEYAFSALTADGRPGDRGEAILRFMAVAARRLRHLPGGARERMFLENGSLLYVDLGTHPELATPECLDPADLVRYVRAGERILAGIAQETQAEARPGAELLLFASNVDYEERTTWASHESYLHRTNAGTLRRRLLPHLVSRVIYTGAGGFNPFSCGLEFTLSPRVHYIDQVVSPNSTRERGILHTKDEPLADHGYHRLHLLCGESLRSDLALWLRVGTTALIVALIESGDSCGDAVQLHAPLQALRDFAADPSCTVCAATAAGLLSATAIQRHYLSAVEARLPALPDWAGGVVREWRSMLDRLDRGPAAVARTLDWAMKRELYAARARRHGIEWDALPAWSELLRCVTEEPCGPRCYAALGNAGAELARAALELGPLSPPPTDPVALVHRLERERSLLWPFILLRQELLEIEARWGQLGDGLFADLDRTGLLAHHAPGVTQIERATVTPPAVGRAHVRGRAIHQLAGKPGTYDAHWSGIYNQQNARVLDLTNPFTSRERWVGPRRQPPSLLERFRTIACGG
jgi:proteasome accessory factor A